MMRRIVVVAIVEIVEQGRGLIRALLLESEAAHPSLMQSLLPL